MLGDQRRQKILSLLQSAEKPLSGGALGKATGVSRQVVVQDIALLRTQGYPILATARGYLLEQPRSICRLFKTCHTPEQTQDELTLIVDLGGCVEDIIINHRIYGRIAAPLNIKNRRDIKKFMEDLATGRSEPLSQVTSGYHFHHVSAESQEILDEIQSALEVKGYLSPLLPYEKEHI